MAAVRSLGRRGALGALALPALLARPASAAADKVRVVTALQATYSIACALAKDTAIEVHAAFPADTSMDQQAAYLAKRRRPDFIAAAQRADAAITIRRIWDLDPLFSSVRAQNIRVIEIDASTPFAPEMAGVALLDTAAAGGSGGERQPRKVSPYIWLSLTNVVRMTDIVAADFRRLSESDGKTIDRNQQQFRAAFLKARAQFDSKLAELDDPSAILLNVHLSYLASDVGVAITDTISKSSYDWNDADLKALIDKMNKSGTRTVVSAHQPKDQIKAAIQAAGGRLAVLDLMDPGVADADGRVEPDGLLKLTNANLQGLLAALTA